MEYTTLGETGLDVSQLCYGTWRFARESNGTIETTRDEAHSILDAAWDRGINFIDTANVYGTPSGTAEEWIGEWLKDYDRKDVVIASKVYWDFERGGYPYRGGLNRREIRRHIQGTLDRLGTNYLDLYYIHRWDHETPIIQTLRALNNLLDEGLVHHLGASSMAAWQLTKALWKGETHNLESFSVTQPKYNAVYRDPVDEYLNVCADTNLAVCPYSPLAGGFLTGKYHRDEAPPSGSRGDLKSWGDEFSDRQWRVLDVIRSIANQKSVPPSNVALQWLIDHEQFTCIPIIGARTIDQLDENCESVEITLSSEERTRIDDAYE